MTAAEVTWLDADTAQIRQPKSSHEEAPFLFLLFGHERSLLLDTGATEDEADFPLRGTIERLTEEWLRRNPSVFSRPYPLLVAHSHAHGDHIAGDALLAERPGTTIVGVTPAEVIAFFGFRAWPEDVVTVDLGNRTLDVLGAPGHEPSSVVFFDRATGILFTGDTVVPGYLYVQDAAVYIASIDRLIRFRDASLAPVTRVCGAHIEMSAEPGVAYPPGTLDQPNEVPLALPPDILDEVLDALRVYADAPGARVGRSRFVVVAE